jgi:hypothetical protein
MLGFKDTLTLSLTKLRVRRVRLVITLIVSGIVFTVLGFLSLVSSGITHSMASFTAEGLLNHYVTTVMSPNFFSQSYMTEAKTIARAETLDAQRIAAQAKEAQRLGIPFDPKTASHAVAQQPGQSGAAGAKYLDTSNPAARQAVVDTHKNTDQDQAKSSSATYHPSAFYQSFQVANGGAIPSQISLTPIIGGKEQEQTPSNVADTGIRDSVVNFQNELTAFSTTLMKPFVLEGASLDAAPGDPLPVLAPIDAAEKLLGMPPLSRKATAQDKIARLGEIRSKAKGLTFEVCFRNSTAINLQGQAKQQAADMAAHKGEAGYQKPSLIYGQAGSACLPTPVASDTRSAEEKALAAKQLQFDEEFGQAKPVTGRMQFKIVGIQPQPGTLVQAPGLEAVFASLFTSTLGQGWFVPLEAVTKNPLLGPLIADPYALATGVRTNYVDFNARADQKSFIEAKGCTFSGVSEPDCSGGRLLLTPFGNPLATFADAQKGISQGEIIALSIIAILAAIVMMGTIGKVIADSRKETSVFRAVGAKRLDIAQIYLLYTLILASLAFLVAVAIGAGFALYLELKYTPDISALAVLAFNAKDLHKTFHLIGFNPLDFAKIYLFVLATALFSAGVPLLGAIKRNPVKDMRED